MSTGKAVEVAKLNYLTNIGDKLNNYHNVMYKCKAPKIPPLLVNNLFILNRREKAKLFTELFSQQCKLVINHRQLSVLPNFNYLTNENL